MDFTLPEDLRHYLAELDEFIETEIRPLEEQDDNIRFFDHRREDARTDWDRGGLPSREWEELLAEARRRADAAGHYRYAFPREYGGRDGTNLGMAVIREHLARKGLGLHCDLQNEHAIVGNNVGLLLMLHYGSPEQKREWIDDLAAGRRHFAFGITEPGRGSDATFMETCATRDGDNWVVAGEKTWNTGIHTASHNLVFARTAGRRAAARHHGFLVPVALPASRSRNTCGPSTCPPTMGASRSTTCGFPTAPYSAARAAGWRSCSTSSTRTASARPPTPAWAPRSSTSTARWSSPKTEAPFGEPLASNQAVQFPLVELHTQGGDMLRALIHDPAWSIDQSGPLIPVRQGVHVQLRGRPTVLRGRDRAMQVHGGLGYAPA